MAEEKLVAEIESQFPPQPLGQGVFYQSQHPLIWRCVKPEAKVSALVCRDNERLLKLLNSSIPSPLELLEEQPLLYSELQRLELKVDLLLEQIGLLLAQQAPLPAAVPLRLTAQELQWWAQEAPRSGETVQVEVYLKEELRRPLVLLGRVKAREAETHGYRVWVLFTDLGEGVREGLERFIFRWHRRHIAQTRKGSPSARREPDTDSTTEF
ncbi:conserved hypothetical protein [Nitrosococcus halophilus Nc 4]|uniref:Cyclic di-GMP receptor atypical PilZ domain-containing protein n=1 Tax=Nitrosococcus halophilus (strain Nc4) TaxID=472759 RepID=D5BV79_NITHN|nr:conserved hypothetical protein [Nitrosococcus halophilus Nc 4]